MDSSDMEQDEENDELNMAAVDMLGEIYSESLQHVSRVFMPSSLAKISQRVPAALE